MTDRSHHLPHRDTDEGAGHDPDAELSPPLHPDPQDADDTGSPGSAQAAAHTGGAPSDPGAGPPDAPDQVTPADPLAEATRWKDLALRAAADLDNFRKRTARDRAESVRLANAALLEQLLPVIDNFEWGLQAASADASSPIYQGMAMVQKQLHDFLASQGMETIDATGQEFDPNLHDAVSQEPHDTVPEYRVISQTRKGYRLHGRLLRPASVTVSRGPGGQGKETGRAGQS